MTPRKKNEHAPIIYAVILVIALYVSAQLAAAVHYVEGHETEGNFYSAVLNKFNDTLTNEPFRFVVCDRTWKYVLYGGLGTVVTLLAISSSRKNYIHGKEFGTARWGTQADIRDLFADTLKSEEIRAARRSRTRLGRWRERRKLHAGIERERSRLLQQKVKELKERNAPREEAASLRKEFAAETARLKREAWKPDLLLAAHKERLKEIEGSSTYSKQEKEAARKEAGAGYEAALKDFYDVNGRIKKINKKYEDADMLFTKTERISIYNYKLNNNTLLLGGSGSGKTRGYVMPNVLQAHSSFVITDPKGEILEKAGHFLSEVKGYRVRVLNLDNKAASDGYNPFVYLRPDDDGFEEKVLSLIEAIIANTDGGEKKGGSDPFWDKAERLFLQAIFFFTATAFTPQDRNMNTVLELIGMLDIAEEGDDVDSDLDLFARHFEETYGRDHIGAQQYREFRGKASGKTAKSIVISAVARLAPFRTKAVRRIFSYDGLHLERLGEEKTAIFVVVPPTDDTFNFIAGMVFTQMFQELQYCATQVHKHDGQRLPVPVRFILDEFANTCQIPNFVKILAYARSFGIGISIILQSLEQIKKMYKDEWGVIVDNCNTLLYLGGISHMDTLEYMSKLIGKGTFDKRTTGRTRGRQGSSSQNFDVIGRELMDSSEIRKIPKQDCIFVVGGRNPFYSKKYEYMSHPNYQFTADANHSLTFEYVPEPPQGQEGNPWTTEKVVPDEGASVNVGKLTTNTDANEALKALTDGKSLPLTDDVVAFWDGAGPGLDLEDLLAENERTAREQRDLLRGAVDVERVILEEDPSVVFREIGENVHRLVPLLDEEVSGGDVGAQELLELDGSLMEDVEFDEDSEGLTGAEGDFLREVQGIDLTQALEREDAGLGGTYGGGERPFEGMDKEER